MEIDVPTTEPVVLESGVENTLIPSKEGDFLITITSDRGVPVVKLTEDEKTLAEGSSLVNREFKAHLKAAQGIEGLTAPQLTTLSDTVSDVALVGPTPAGYYRVDFVTEAAAPEFQYDGNVTIQNQNVVLTNVVGEAGAQGLLPLEAAQGIVTGKNLRGTLIFSQGTALGAGQRAAVASFQIPTGGDAGTFKGTAVITFVGNIA